ncbi:hypothetical protein EG329_002554 [Mollisiaceae sp. DMI_Dod_QoI]|nr:hypothetical protein EG329_002554 [Helotiales sp. DMI_Dod_QoI]
MTKQETVNKLHENIEIRTTTSFTKQFSPRLGKRATTCNGEKAYTARQLAVDRTKGWGRLYRGFFRGQGLGIYYGRRCFPAIDNQTGAWRGFASSAIAPSEEEDVQQCNTHEAPYERDVRRHFSYNSSNPSTQLSILGFPPTTSTESTSLPRTFRAAPKGIYGQWDESHWTHEQLEFESSLDQLNLLGKTRLLDLETHKHDMMLWGVLFEYRKRIYGYDGILMFFDAIVRRDIMIPTRGILADRFWLSFLDLGFRNPVLLDRIGQYSDYIWAAQKRSWSKLYVYIIRFFLVNGNLEGALLWHNRLLENHSPGPTPFAQMCRHVVFQYGDMQALRIIYLENTHRNVYSKVVPLLCQREDFKAALNWHFFFLKNGDLPSSPKSVEPLIHFLAVYEPRDAARVTKSLVAAGVSFASNMSRELVDNTKISREMMNLIHGQTLNVPVKTYNDSLGARWFATRWISLDTAINGVHALGIEEIGPLSLQAIALRDPNPKSVKLRIAQLEALGISLGSSLYSRAINYFANRGDREYLEGLINSDQHPDTVENADAQEELLLSFARAKDWVQYRRTVKIRALASRSPTIERWNLELRSLIRLGNREGFKATLDQMEIEKVPVKSRTITLLIRSTLRPRRTGHRPMVISGKTYQGRYNDLNIIVGVLKDIMESGSYVPIIHWREIIRRLGMSGRFNDLRSLALFLATWYAPQESSSLSRCRYYHVPSQVSTAHSLHPLNIIFNKPFQRAVVEWGFISGLRQKREFKHDPRRQLTQVQGSFLPDMTSGIVLLKLLSERGVHINGPSVRKALINRLVTYYGPGVSNKIENRRGKAIMQGKMSMAARQIDRALGGTFFSTIDLPRLIEAIAKTRLRRVQRRKQSRHEMGEETRRSVPNGKQTWHSEVW